MQGLPTRVNLTPVKFNLLSSLLLSSSSSPQPPFPLLPSSSTSSGLQLVVLTLSAVLFFALYFRGEGLVSPLAPLSLSLSYLFFLLLLVPLSFFFVSVTFDAHWGIRVKHDIDQTPDFNYRVET